MKTRKWPWSFIWHLLYGSSPLAGICFIDMVVKSTVYCSTKSNTGCTSSLREATRNRPVLTHWTHRISTPWKTSHGVPYHNTNNLGKLSDTGHVCNKHADWLFLTSREHCNQLHNLTQIGIGHWSWMLNNHHPPLYIIHVFHRYGKTSCRLHLLGFCFGVFFCAQLRSSTDFCLNNEVFLLNNKIFWQEQSGYVGGGQ